MGSGFLRSQGQHSSSEHCWVGGKDGGVFLGVAVAGVGVICGRGSGGV